MLPNRPGSHVSLLITFQHAILFIIATLIGITNFEGLIYDIWGSAAELVEDHESENDVTIGETKVGEILNKREEFPYDWDAGDIVYVVFLSAIFMGKYSVVLGVFSSSLLCISNIGTAHPGTIILEGVVTSLMAKVTPAKLNDAFINNGLLATLIGTFGRVFADLLITMSALLDVYVFVDFVNATFAPLLLLALFGFYLVKRNYRQFLISSN